MFEIAFFIGIYSYIIFLLGIFGLLLKSNIIMASVFYIFLMLIYSIKNKKFKFPKKIAEDKLSIFVLVLIAAQIGVNLIGVLGPEVSFDALWYHLTLPKIFLLNHVIFHIPGNLLYYSDMPKLAEMLYIAGLSISNEILPKFIHFSLGILILIAIYSISKKYLSRSFSLLAALIFYSNLVVGWESITSYVDLTRAFFEVMAFWGFIKWIDSKERKWLSISGFMLGFAITTKLISIETLSVFIVIIFYWGFVKKDKVIESISSSFGFVISALIIPLPWFMFSFLNTNNPVYPYFSNIPVDSGSSLVFPNILNFLKDIYLLFLGLNDPISPVYLIVLPLIILFYKTVNFKVKIFVIYTFMSFLVWYLTLEQRGGRFILPYLPVASILCVIVIDKLKSKSLRRYMLILIMLLSLVSIGYRGIANKKYILYISGQESKSQFLSNNLNFSFGDFYDIDGYFARNIKNSDNVLLYGFHNLYYISFPFVDSSWIKKGDKFNYIATQNSSIPSRFSDWKEIYYNSKTKVALYSKEGRMWAY